MLLLKACINSNWLIKVPLILGIAHQVRGLLGLRRREQVQVLLRLLVASKVGRLEETWGLATVFVAEVEDILPLSEDAVTKS